MFDDVISKQMSFRAKFETIVKNGFDMENLDLPESSDPRAVDSDKLEAHVCSFVENVMGFTLVTRCELSTPSKCVEKAERHSPSRAEQPRRLLLQGGSEASSEAKTAAKCDCLR